MYKTQLLTGKPTADLNINAFHFLATYVLQYIMQFET
jgi:hypothetical protein